MSLIRPISALHICQEKRNDITISPLCTFVYRIFQDIKEKINTLMFYIKA